MTTNQKQLDVFNDPGSVQAANELHAALSAADAKAARLANEALADIEPTHQWIASARVLIEALTIREPQTHKEAVTLLPRIDQDWTRAADKIFGAGRHNFLDGLWRCVAERLQVAEFDSSKPKLHPSYAYAQLGDWAMVERSITETPDFATHPVLLTRIAQANWRQDCRTEAVHHWFMLCWTAPEELASLIRNQGVPDKSLCDAWATARRTTNIVAATRFESCTKPIAPSPSHLL